MSTIMRGKRQLVNSTKVGMPYPLNVQGLVPMDKLTERDGKGKENTIAATLCDRSYATQRQVQSQTYRFIAPRKAVSHTSIQQSSLPCQYSTNGLENIPEKLVESPKPAETPLKRSFEFPTTTSNCNRPRCLTFADCRLQTVQTTDSRTAQRVGGAEEECVKETFFGGGGGGGMLVYFSKVTENAIITIKLLRRNLPDVGVTSGQKPSTKIIYNVLQTSVGLF